MPSRIATRSISIAVAATLATLALGWSPALGAPVAVAPPSVAVEHADVLSTTSRSLDVSVSVALQRPAAAMDIRLRVLAANGSVLLQETQSRRRLEAATYVLGFTRELRPRDLREGRDRLEVQVTVSGQAPVTVTEPIYVVDPSRAPVRLAIVVRADATPATAPGGERSRETTEAALLREQVMSLMHASASSHEHQLTFAVPPFLVDEWSAVGSPVPADADVLRLPYADPDVWGLETIDAVDDLAYQLDRPSRVASDTIASRTSTGAVLAGNSLSPATARVLSSRGIGYALVAPDAVVSGAAGRETSASPGVHGVVDTTLTALVFDAKASTLLSDTPEGVPGLLDLLFSRLTTPAAKGRPVVAVVRLGPGSTVTAAGLQALLASLGRFPWVRLVTAAEAAAMPRTDPVALPAKARTGPAAPAGYWDSVSVARTRMLALRSATGPRDPDVLACAEDVMFAESRAWGGADGGWAGAAEGLAFASSAERRASKVLSAVSLAVPTVTLSGNAGKVPVSITNASGRELRLTLAIRSQSVRLPGGPTVEVVARPGENILAVPVDLRESIKGDLRFDLNAGASSIASATCEVRASYIDRLVVLGTVVLVLLVFLWYIRKRSRADGARPEADADDL